MNVGLIGCGLQGWRRAKALRESQDTLVLVSDIDQAKAIALAAEMKCEVAVEWEDITKNKEIDAVIVCSPNGLHAKMSISALENGKNVLCEKPLAGQLAEAQQMVEVAKQSAKTLKCGFNLRHHPGVRQIKKWCDAGIIGELTFLRCRYGMCGRIGYEKDWRGNKAMSGGGELLDQGVHILDLFRWFAGDFPEVTGFTATNYWNIAPLEDNAFALLRSNNKQIASLHVSWCQWRNLFSFEIFGKDGYVAVEGLGGSYGVERAILGRKSFTEPFKEEIIDFRGDDYSWRDEWREFVTAITEGREPLGSGLDGLEALKLVHAIYKSNQKSSMVTL